jgi:hypothetical protein
MSFEEPNHRVSVKANPVGMTLPTPLPPRPRKDAWVLGGHSLDLRAAGKAASIGRVSLSELSGI